MLMDIPTALVLVVFHVLGLLTPWRLLYFWRAVWAYKWGDNEHSLVATHFGRQLADLPAVVLGAVAAVVAVWRAWDMVVAVYKEERAQEACVRWCAARVLHQRHQHTPRRRDQCTGWVHEAHAHASLPRRRHVR